ncbi:MAG: hypothetical protein MJZ76_05750 [Bacteroidales bacterium]|nr:hypothetical protein [Bacteroidales bacterium]
MKKIVLALFIIATMAFIVVCCQKESPLTSDYFQMHIDGEPSDIGEKGTVVQTDIDGVSDVDISVVEVKDGVSEFAGTMTVTNPRYLKILRNHPQYFDVNGNNVRVHDVKFKFTDKGIENKTGVLDGVVIRYDAKEGDNYIGGRQVTHVSTDNDYQWALGTKIKVIEMDCQYNSDGVKHLKYWCNHRFGFVGFQLKFDDGTTDDIPIRLY